jgi:hypothetical protein
LHPPGQLSSLTDQRAADPSVPPESQGGDGDGDGGDGGGEGVVGDGDGGGGVGDGDGGGGVGDGDGGEGVGDGDGGEGVGDGGDGDGDVPSVEIRTSAQFQNSSGHELSPQSLIVGPVVVCEIERSTWSAPIVLFFSTDRSLFQHRSFSFSAPIVLFLSAFNLDEQGYLDEHVQFG